MNQVEAALRSLVPTRSSIDRDRILFAAGQASIRRTSAHRAWMAVAASLALLAAGEGVLLAHRPEPRMVERVVIVRVPAPSPEPAPKLAEVRPPAAPLEAGPTARDRLAWQILRYGLDGLPAARFSARNDAEAWSVAPRQRLRDELLKDLESGDPS